MKKILFFTTLFLAAYNVFYLVSDEQSSVITHAVSESNSVASGTGKEVISSDYAIVDVEETVEEITEFKNDFEVLYPNLKITGSISEERLVLIKKTLLGLPADKLQKLSTIRVRQVEGETRGLGGSSTIILNDYELSDEEFVSVFIHELGHAVDLGGIQGSPVAKKSVFNDGATPIYVNDLSTKYYAYSWDNSSEHNSQAKNRDFVSGYAMTDPFEDFAESFVYYVLHNQDFKVLAQKNEKLELKYAFIRDFVFEGEELKTGTGDVNPNKRVWDITKLAIEL